MTLSTLIIITMTMSMMFMFMKHPLSMTILILTTTMTCSMMIAFMSKTSWFSYILFLIMIGGMLVLFIYMTSIASNEKFKFSLKMMILSTTMFTMMITAISLDPNMLMNLLQSWESKNIMMVTPITMKFFNSPMNMIMIMLMMYLFITMVAVTKITNPNKGPLRQKM